MAAQITQNPTGAIYKEMALFFGGILSFANKLLMF